MIDYDILAVIFIAIGFLLSIGYAACTGLFYHTGVRHLDRSYFALLICVPFTVATMIFLRERILVCTAVAIPVGCALATLLYARMKSIFVKRFDGTAWRKDAEDRVVEPLASITIAIIASVAFCFVDFQGPNSLYIYSVLLCTLVGWFGASVMEIRFLRQLESRLGYPVFEREGESTES